MLTPETHLAESRLQAGSPSPRVFVDFGLFWDYIWCMRGTVTERSPGVWRLRVYIGRDPITGRPRQASRTVHTSKRGGKGEALAALAEFFTELEDTGIRKGGDHTVGSLFTAYIARCKSLGRKQSTIETYEMVEKRLTEEIKATTLRDLTTEQLDQFYWGLEMSPATVEQTHAVIRAALHQALKWEWISRNVADLSTPVGKVDKVEREPLKLTDIRRMVELAYEDGDVVLATAIAVAALTGARRGELCGLRWDDLDPAAGTITIERQWVPGKGGQHLTTLKSGEGKVINLGPDGLGLLARYWDRMGAFLGRDPHGWLLSYDPDEPMRAKTLGAQITAIAKRLDLKVTTHSFRRASATQLIASGVDIDSAARRMGHTKEVMMGSYVLGADDRQRAAAVTIEDRFTELGLPLAELLPAEDQ